MSTFDAEQKEYRERLHRQVEGIDRILNINSYGVIPHETVQQLQSVRERAAAQLRKLETGEYEIAIVGLEKAGKSTFANALMGNNILPTKEGRCTYTATSIRYAEEDHAEVEFFSRNEFNESFRKNLEQMKIPHANALSFDTLSLHDYQMAFQKLDTQARAWFEATVNKDVEDILTYSETILAYLDQSPMRFSGKEKLKSEEFKRFIEDPRYAIAVKEIILYSHELGTQMKNAVIYDVPGFDSPTEMHKAQTKEKMKRADAILFVTSAYKPSLTGPSVDIFRTQVDEDGIRFGDKMFVFANMADRAEELEKNMDIMRADLQRHSVMTAENLIRIVPGSAKAHLQKQNQLDGNDALCAVQEKRLQYGDGIETIYKMLEDYNRGERFAVLKRRVNNLQNDIESVIKALFGDEDYVKSGISSTERERMAMHLIADASSSIERELESFRSELQLKYSDIEHPLTDMLRESVEGINSTVFRVTDEELDLAKKKVEEPSQNTQAVDVKLREWKRDKIYQHFQDCVITVADGVHKECDSQIEKIFINGLGVNESSAHYEEIQSRVHEYVTKQKKEILAKAYYDSLVHRFSESVFQLLLHYPFGYGSADRYKYFDRFRSSFYSLAMFDEASDETRTPDQQPLHYELLYHDNERRKLSGVIAEATSYIKDLIGEYPTRALCERISDLVNLCSKGNALDLLMKKLPKSGKTIAVEMVLDILDNEIDKLGGASKNLSVDEESYLNWAAQMPPKDYNLVREYIDEDIDILHSVLQTTIVPAICIETPFLALEVGTIRNVINSTKTDNDEFINFISANIPLIKAEEYRSIDQEQQKRQIRISIQKEIQTILDEMREITDN